MWTQNKLFQPQHPQNDPICTCDEGGLIGCPVHDPDITHFPRPVVRWIHNDAVELCAKRVLDWFDLPSQSRTKAQLLEMIREQKRGNR